MILNHRLFAVHREIQYYTDDVNFRIDQKGFSSISYTLMYSHLHIYMYKDPFIRREARGTRTYFIAVNVLLFVYETQQKELDIHYNLDEISQLGRNVLVYNICRCVLEETSWDKMFLVSNILEPTKL